MRNHSYFVYIVTNFSRTVIYVGVTNSLIRRITEHNKGLIDGFTKKYNCKFLIYYEHYPDINIAISREKEIKKWNRKKKEELIEKFNPEWKFLNDGLASIESVYK